MRLRGQTLSSHASEMICRLNLQIGHATKGSDPFVASRANVAWGSEFAV